MKMLDKVDWEDVKETAKFYYTDSTTTLNLYPALILSVILLFCKYRRCIGVKMHCILSS